MPLTRFKLSAIEDGGIATADLADGAVTTAKLADSAVTSVKTSNLFTNTEIAGTEAARMPVGTTAQRANPKVGDLRFNTDLDQLEQYTSESGWQGISPPPSITSVDINNIDESDDPQTIVITGANFDANATGVLLDNNGSTLTPTTSTRNSSTQITIVYSGGDTIGSGTAEPLDVKVINGSGLNTVLENAIAIDETPIFATAAGTSVATVYEDTAYATTINNTNASDFDVWATNPIGYSGGVANSPLKFLTDTGGPSSATGYAESYDAGARFWKIDLRIPRRITNIAWAVRDGDGGRTVMNWRGSNDLSTWTTLYTNPSPSSSNDTSFNESISDTTKYRYLDFHTEHNTNNYGRYNSLVITLEAESTLSTSSLSATDPEGSTVTYVQGATGSLITPFSFNTTGPAIDISTAKINEDGTYSSSGVQHNFSVDASDGTGNTTTRVFNILRKWMDGSSSSLPAQSANDIYNIDNNFADGNYYIKTPSGGIQQVRCLNVGGAGWMLVARYQANAGSTVTNQASSVRGLTDISQNGANAWSADFGGYEWYGRSNGRVMVWGASDFANRTGHSVNWIYYIPSDRSSWCDWLFNTSGSYNGLQFNTGHVQFQQLSASYATKHGQTCAGAADGPFKGSRWTNTNYVGHRISDGASGNCGLIPRALFSPTSNMHQLHGADDAKWSVHATATQSGQDTFSSQLFGYDDTNGPAHYDVGTGQVANDSSRNDYSNAVTFWIK